VLGSLGFPELIFIFVLALLVFGPKRLPELGRTVGRALAEFRKATTELKRTINTELIDHELREADPRRIVREQLRETKAGLERALSGTPEAELQGTTGAPTLVLPSGAVSRINSSADDSPLATGDNDAPGVVEPLIETPPVATSAAVERPAAN
jgi:TatA/E family protein of Tat protein translocase